MKYCIDELKVKPGSLYCTGWAAPDEEGCSITVGLSDPSGRPFEVKPTYRHRPDVAVLVYGKSEQDLYGFSFSLPYDSEGGQAGKVPLLTVEAFRNGESVQKEDIPLADAPAAAARWKRSHSLPGRAKRFLKAPDKKAYFIEERFFDLDGEDKKYAIWKETNRPDRKELAAQKEFARREDPLISFVMPVYRPNITYLLEMIKSVRCQSAGSFELVISCAKNESAEVKGALEKAAKDSRIRLVWTEVNEGISTQTNAGIAEAKGSWIAFIDQDDLLMPNLLYEYLRAIRFREADVIYCDEDKLDSETGYFIEPNFKPDYSPDLLACNNYICHMVMVRREVLDRVGLLDRRYDGAQDHDLLLRLSEVTGKFVHIPKVLYSWRIHAVSTAADADAKSEAFDAGAAAVAAHYSRLGIRAEVTPLSLKGWYRSSFTLEKKPLVSIIIPNRDHAEDLRRCTDSLRRVNTYGEYELIIVENGSTEEETFRLYDELSGQGKAKILHWDRGFNYSAINNFGAAKAQGEYLLLLNNDTEVISPDFLESMLAYGMREDVGAVGARLLYPDGTVQHAGVLVGVSEGADHVFLQYIDQDPGYMGRSIVSQDMSAVTGACLLTRASLYRELGGLDEAFTVAYNDVDYCMKVREAGYFVVYDAFAKLTHAESKSRGYEDNEEKKKRFEEEKALLRSRWKKLSLGDPYYNINLSLKNGYYRLP